jgi:hypothetical protein
MNKQRVIVIGISSQVIIKIIAMQMSNHKSHSRKIKIRIINITNSILVKGWNSKIKIKTNNSNKS